MALDVPLGFGHRLMDRDILKSKLLNFLRHLYKASLSIYLENSKYLSLFSFFKNLAHNFFCFSTNILAEIIERFQISFIQFITNNFNVHFIQILFINAFLKKWSYKKINSRSFFLFFLNTLLIRAKYLEKNTLI